MGTTVLLVCFVIQFCVHTTLLIQTNVQQENKFHTRTDVETKVDPNLERNVSKVNLEQLIMILYSTIAEPSKAFRPWTNWQLVKNPAVPLTNTTN